MSEFAFIRPSLAQTASEPPSGADWVHEIKFDGYRVQAHIAASRVRLFTRNGLDWTYKFGLVVSDLKDLPLKTAIIDGEAIVRNAAGIADFHALQHELAREADARIVLMAFDLLYLNDKDVRALPLLDRKALLKSMLGKRQPSSLLVFSDHMQGDGGEILAKACELGLEGIISKRVDRSYHSGRSADWLKSKCLMADPFVVVGYLTQVGTSEAIGSLVLAYYRGRSLVYAGRVGTGLSASEASAVWDSLQSIRAEAPPFASRLEPAQRAGVVWVKPLLVAQIEYRAWTPDGVLRHAAFKAFRQDKLASQIRRPASLKKIPGGMT